MELCRFAPPLMEIKTGQFSISPGKTVAGKIRIALAAGRTKLIQLHRGGEIHDSVLMRSGEAAAAPIGR